MSDLRQRAVVAVAVPALGAAALAVFALAGATSAVAAQPHRAHGSPGQHESHGSRGSHARTPQALPLYARPADGSAVVGRLASGDRFTTHQTDGGWTFVHDRTNRAEGWAHFTHPHHTAQQPAQHAPGHD
jgi:hypothetical protein